MRKIFAFLAVTVDGYHEGPECEIDWHNAPDTADSGFPVASGFPRHDDDRYDEVDTLLFGRVTYELMASFWPTPAGIETDPHIAARMNRLPKIVVSRSLDRADWSNTRLLQKDVTGELRSLKQQDGKSIAILGSSTLTASLLQEGLVDEVRILVNPVILGAGRSLFAGAGARIPLSLTSSRTFPSGNVLLYYAPVRS